MHQTMRDATAPSQYSIWGSTSAPSSRRLFVAHCARRKLPCSHACPPRVCSASKYEMPVTYSGTVSMPDSARLELAWSSDLLCTSLVHCPCHRRAASIRTTRSPLEIRAAMTRGHDCAGLRLVSVHRTATPTVRARPALPSSLPASRLACAATVRVRASAASSL